MATGLSSFNRSLNLVPKRAESRQSDQLRSTFVDSGVASALEVVDHQVLYGRRGTGKTHALRYLESSLAAEGEIAVYVDLRTVGSPDGLFGTDPLSPQERAGRLLVDLLGELHNAILEAVLHDEDLLNDGDFVEKIDALSDAITSIRIIGEVEETREAERRVNYTEGASVNASIASGPSVSLGVTDQVERGSATADRVVRRGAETFRLNFAEVARALRGVAGALTIKRVWILLDEWSSVPQDLQPYLGEFLVRCILPLQRFTVKIGAIEQQSVFRIQADTGEMIGIELGADVSANIDLDEFMVFEQNEERARDFFRGLVFRHLSLGVEEGESPLDLSDEQDVIRLGFSDRRAFDELVRAAEGVPRDAINIAAKAALQARDKKISVPDIRVAARSWFQSDKEAALRSRDEALALLNHIIDEVIRGRRARGFLVNQRSARSEVLRGLFDARVLHLVRRGYSAQDEPGERYDVYVIDYGAYVDLIQTKYAPQGMLISGDKEKSGYVEVPTQDLRAIRRSVLNVDAFELTADAGRN